MLARLFLFFLLIPAYLGAQSFTVEGQVVDDSGSPLSYVTILLFEEGRNEALTGTTSDMEGMFLLDDLSMGTYTLQFSMIGYGIESRTIVLDGSMNLGPQSMREAEEALQEVTLSAKKPTLQRMQGKLVFNVENSSLSTGNTYNLLGKTPGVIVIGDNLQIRNRPTTVYLNGRRVYLSKTEITSFLKNLDAASIKQVEVITNPGPEFDAESGTVLNIVTSRIITPGYKGSVSANYEQAIFSKYQFGTSQFFKNDWLNVYGSYSYSPRKENKDQDTYIRFMGQNPENTTAVWESDFNRVTHSYGHQANIVADIDFDESNSLSITANYAASPNKEFLNYQDTDIQNAQGQLDSTFVTESIILSDTYNFSGGMEYKTQFQESEGFLKLGGNYITYTNDQTQELESTYYRPNQEILNTIAFNTLSQQDADIYTAYADYGAKLFDGNFEMGIKYSNIDTKSGLEFFDILGGVPQFNTALSDTFDYNEAIFAAYLNFERSWEKWEVALGLRGENTEVEGASASLGLVNTQSYFKLFPSASLGYAWDAKNRMELAYARKIQRPRYQSLNPFRYYVNENNYNEGNPNLVPAIDDKITLSYSHDNRWFVEAYYQQVENSLEILNFQDNDTFTIRQLDSNILDYLQYSFDVIYTAPFADYWFFSVVTSTYYLENTFLALESVQERYTNSTMGFFGQVYNQFQLNQKGDFTSELTARYISNLISGSLDYNDIFNLSISFRKSFWQDRASISFGVDDVFNTNNIRIVSKYYNQDNSYFPRPESQKFWMGMQFNFGNKTLRENRRTIQTQEGDRLD